MKVPISWLKDYVDINISIEELKEKLFSSGFEVEEIIETGADIKNIRVAQINSIEPHPDADRLSVCKVNVGEYGDSIQIVTGAKNIRVGDLVPCALDGAVVSGGKTISSGKLRGVMSSGMLCSGEELGINDYMYEGASVDGILILKEKAELGSDIKKVVGLGDFILDINVTANRPDCQSILGIAREVAAITDQKVKMPSTDFSYDSSKTSDFLSVEVRDKDLCPRYIAHYVSDIKIAQSPRHIKQRLQSVGIRPINNIVDITNFILIELGQPMHAFDYSTIGGGKIIVRRANNGEKMVTLDEKEHTLTSDDLVIADAKSAVAIAGVMGGLDSGINDNTKNIVFESAKFARDSIRRTSKKLSIRTDSSARFEKGVDAYTTEFAMKRALNLIGALGCGAISSQNIDTFNIAADKKRISANITRINKLLGLNLSAKLMKDILFKLEFEVNVNDDELDILVPQFREDIENYTDIAEELIRIYGYDNIKPTFLNKASITNGGKTKAQKDLDIIKDILVNNGANETITYSFVSPKQIEKLGFDKGSKELNLIKLLNPLGEELSVMRTSLVPSMIDVISKNIKRKNQFGCFFEVANLYLCDKTPITELPTETQTLIIGAYGSGHDFFTVKGIVENIASEFLLDFNFIKGQKPYLHIGKTAEITCMDKIVGYIGQFNPILNEAFDIENDIYLAELNIDLLLALNNSKLIYENFSKIPSVERDLAIVVDETVSWGELKNAATVVGGAYLKQIDIFDIYRGEIIGKDKKSIAFSMLFNADDRTLSQEETDDIIAKILKNIASEVNGYIRT